MSLDLAYDPANIFARVIRGDLPCIRVYEDDATLSFMDIFPQTEGHCLVIPKRAPATGVFDIAPADLADLIIATQRVAKAVKAALRPDGVRLVQFNGAAAGQTVFHIHFHVIPMYGAAPAGPHAAGARGDMGDLELLAARIREAF